MVRRLKPENQLSESAKYWRERKIRDPIGYQKYLAYQNQKYWKHKTRWQISKKLQTKQKRIEAIKLLGEKCASCGEKYNPHARISNLQFDHKFYINTKAFPRDRDAVILQMKNEGIDPNTQFMLLCRTCHMAITYLRKDPEKTKHILELAIQQGIISRV